MYDVLQNYRVSQRGYKRNSVIYRDEYEYEQEKLAKQQRLANIKPFRKKRVPKYKNNASGFLGVRYNKRNNRWIADINYKGKPLYLGSYINITDAIKVRKKAEVLYFGQLCDRSNEPTLAGLSGTN